MTNEIAVTSLSEEQVALIARTIAKDATKDELALFVGMCKRTGLDPFSRQIYFIKANGRVMTQISVDGFRVIAERSGDYAGQDAPEFKETNGVIDSCSVAVYRWRGDTRYQAAVGVAYWKEYAKGGTWTQMPHTMLAKVAECLALRKAFPNDLSGLYAPEEMDQAGPKDHGDDVPPPTMPSGTIMANADGHATMPHDPMSTTTKGFDDSGVAVTASGNPKGTITQAQNAKLYAVLGELGAEKEAADAFCMERFECRISGLSKEQAITLIDALEKKLAVKKAQTPAAEPDVAEQVAEAFGGQVVKTPGEIVRENMEATRAAIRAENA